DYGTSGEWRPSTVMGSGYGQSGAYRSEDRSRAMRRGPKGYQRTDERIKEDIYERVMEREHLDVEDVTVEVKDGRVTLQGEVPERWMKHEVEDIADGCMGVKDVENNIRVKRGLLSALFGSDESREEDRDSRPRGTSGTVTGSTGASTSSTS